MRKYFILALSFIALPAQAVCPVCTVAVGAGLGLSRWLGIDDTITGIWIGGLTVSLIGWTINWLNKKNIVFYGRKIAITLGYYALIIGPLYYQEIIGHELNKLWGVDKLILGVITGSLGFLSFALWYEKLKQKNNGHAYFPLQKVAMPVGILAILSLIFYFLTK